MEIVEIHLNTVDSTNTYAKTHGSSFARDKITCITAEEQTSGKGQFQKKWISPSRVNLYATFYFHLPPNTQNLTELTLTLGKSIKKVLEERGVPASMKWPNDVLIQGKKVAGILCETIFHKTHIEIILGFGLNVNMGQEDLIKIDQPATSLKNETGHAWDKEELLRQIQKQWLLDIQFFR
jgi:BirA family biotin operon repressor/biotin-[acetyl-CoA-carboxylase] ligase